MFFCLVMSVEQRKNSRSPRRVEPQGSDALPLSHRDFTASGVCYDVHIKRVLHTAMISNVNSVIFVDTNKRDDKF